MRHFLEHQAMRDFLAMLSQDDCKAGCLLKARQARENERGIPSSQGALVLTGRPSEGKRGWGPQSFQERPRDLQEGTMRKIAVLLLFLVLILPPWAEANDLLDEAKALNRKVVELYSSGRYEEAIPYAERVLQIREKALGKEHPDVAVSLSNLAGLYWATGRYAEAEPLLKRALAIREKVLGKNHPDVAQSLNNLAVLYRDTGRYAEAEPLYQRALQIREKALGKEHPDVAVSLNNLAGLYWATGRYAEAEPLYVRALQIAEKDLGKDHLEVARSLNNLAVLYRETGRYAKAEPLAQRALQIAEKDLGKDHPHVASSLNNLAGLYSDTGRYAEAEPLYQRSLQIREKSLGKDHPDVASSLNNLAELYRDTGRYAEAEPLYQRALQIWQKVLGKDHPDVASSLNNLAELYRDTGRYAEAEPLYQRSLQIREKSLGKDHPHVASSLNNVAELYRDTGRYAEAEPLLKGALQIWEKALGKDHPHVARSLSNLAGLSASLGKHAQAHSLFLRSLSIQDCNREDAFLLLSERQKLAYMEERQGNVHAFLSHTLQFLPSNPSAPSEALDAWLRWKGAVMEAQGRYLEAVYASPDPQIDRKFKELTAIRLDLAQLQRSRPEKLSLEEYRARIRELTAQKEAHEAELSRLSQDFALEKLAGKADGKRIASLLPPDSLYLDFARIKTYDFAGNKWGNPRYLAFVLIPKKEPEVKLLDLGEPERIEAHLRAYRQEMDKVKSGQMPDPQVLQREAKALYGLVFQPFEPFLPGRGQLFLSPDGDLHLVPFEVLIGPRGRYLMEEYRISYIGAGRDIVRFTDRTSPKPHALLFADPDYNLGLPQREKVLQELQVPGEIRGAVTRDASQLWFRPLPGTEKEAQEIEKALKQAFSWKVGRYQRERALEEILLSADSPQVLHLATHGYFLPDEAPKIPQRGLALERETLPDPGIENPMLRSGIALAGANASLKQGRDEGLVSAEKILGLRLKGTGLVVLSACETGLGEVRSGEGVFGLQRAFILSGAQTLVMSLWSVPSAETTELMSCFYRLLSQGIPKAEALRQAKLALKEKKQNPFFWGAFVLVGRPE